VFLRTGAEFSIIPGREKLRVFEPMVLIMSDISLKTGVSVDEFLKLRSSAEEISGSEARFKYFLAGFGKLVGAGSEKSLGVSADEFSPGKGFFQVYFVEVARSVYFASGHLNSISELSRVFGGASEMRRDRARHTVLYTEKILDVVPVDDWDIIYGFETDRASSGEMISARSKELNNLRRRYAMRKARKPVPPHKKDRVLERRDEFLMAFEGLEMSKAVDGYLSAAGLILAGMAEKSDIPLEVGQPA